MKKANVGSMKSVIAVEVNDFRTGENFLARASLCEADVQAYLPCATNTVIGAIRDVDVDISEGKMPQLVSSTATIVHTRILNSSSSMKIVGLVCNVVRQYAPRPLQCRKCMSLLHLIGVCPNTSACSRCGYNATSDVCSWTGSKCINCSGDHVATSLNFSHHCREMKMCQKMARDHSSHEEAATSGTLLVEVAGLGYPYRGHGLDCLPELPSQPSNHPIKNLKLPWPLRLQRYSIRQGMTNGLRSQLLGKKQRVYLGAYRKLIIFISGSSGL